jgi:hypothetical protein
MTTVSRPDPRAFRERLLAREPLLGTFMKTPSAHNTEIIGGLGFDFVARHDVGRGEVAHEPRRDRDDGALGPELHAPSGHCRAA